MKQLAVTAGMTRQTHRERSAAMQAATGAFVAGAAPGVARAPRLPLGTPPPATAPAVASVAAGVMPANQVSTRSHLMRALRATARTRSC